MNLTEAREAVKSTLTSAGFTVLDTYPSRTPDPTTMIELPSTTFEVHNRAGQYEATSTLIIIHETRQLPTNPDSYSEADTIIRALTSPPPSGIKQVKLISSDLSLGDSTRTTNVEFELRFTYDSG